MSRLNSILEVVHEAPHDQVRACARGDWRSLVVIATEPGGSTMALAQTLVDECNVSDAKLAKVFCAEDVTREGAIVNLVAQVVAHLETGGRAVVPIDAMTSRRFGQTLMAVADAALLCVHLGVTTTKSAQKTIELIGKERFIGAIVIDANAEPLR